MSDINWSKKCQFGSQCFRRKDAIYEAIVRRYSSYDKNYLPIWKGRICRACLEHIKNGISMNNRGSIWYRAMGCDTSHRFGSSWLPEIDLDRHRRSKHDRQIQAK